MKRSARVLIVTPVFTHPPIQGNAARILAFGRELKARGMAVDVLHYRLDYAAPDTDAAMRREWAFVQHIPARPHKLQQFADCWGLDDWCHEHVVDAVETLQSHRRYDAVIANYVWMSRCLLDLTDAMRIIDTHDMFGDRHRLSIENGLEPNWYFTRPSEEAKGFDRADLVIGIQPRETANIASRTTAETMTVGHPMPAWYLTNADSEAKAAMFGYFASGNPWNVRSVKSFDRALSAASYACDWAVAGTICKAPLDLETHPFHFGVVRSPEDFYRHVDCCINPMTGGTGLKIKSIEAMAYGRPIIGSAHAFDGLEPQHDMHRIASMSDMVDAIREYMYSERLRSDLLMASRQLFVRYLDVTRRQYDALAERIVRH